MKVTLGKAGLGKSWQEEFLEVTSCVHCDGESRIGFVVHEEIVCDELLRSLHQNEPDKDRKWLHDRCAVAVYFCKKCLNTTALYNQG